MPTYNMSSAFVQHEKKEKKRKEKKKIFPENATVIRL